MNWNNGDIVYWCENKGNGKYEVSFGMVDQEYSDKVCVDLLTLKERRRINGIPYNEFKDYIRYKKLPKGWTYNTELFELTFDDAPEECKKLVITNPEDVKKGYDKGYLIKANQKDWSHVEAEITKEGYRLVKRHPMWEYHPTYVGIEKHRLKRTWDEAKAEVDANIQEFQRQASLSDEEWSKEQIQKSVDRWAKLWDLKPDSDEYKRVSDYLFKLDNIEDIETRVVNEGIQWKYWKNKKWITVNV